MTLSERIERNFIEARKTKQSEVLAALRLLKSAIKNAEIEKRGTLTDDDILKVLRTEIKRRKESVSVYRKAGREDLAVKEEAEQKVYEMYVPESLSDNELQVLLKKVLDDTGAKDMRDIGRVMSAVMKEVSGRADGSVIKKMVENALQK